MRLALGTAQLGLDYGIANRKGQMAAGEGARVLAEARDRGIDTLDTAMSYGDSEERLGEIGVTGWRVITKLPAAPVSGDAGDWVHRCVRQSLARLRLQNLHALLLHRPGELHGPHGGAIVSALLELKESGLISLIGVSIYDPDDLPAVFEALRPDLVQAPFNVLDRRLAESGWLDRLGEERVEVHTRSAFLQGLLLMPDQARPRKFDPWIASWRAWSEYLDQSGLTPVEACLGFVLSHPQITRVVVGVDSLAQLRELLGATDREVPRAPASLAVRDIELIDPSRWSALSPPTDHRSGKLN